MAGAELRVSLGIASMVSFGLRLIENRKLIWQHEFASGTVVSSRNNRAIATFTTSPFRSLAS